MVGCTQPPIIGCLIALTKENGHCTLWLALGRTEMYHVNSQDQRIRCSPPVECHKKPNPGMCKMPFMDFCILKWRSTLPDYVDS